MEVETAERELDPEIDKRGKKQVWRRERQGMNESRETKKEQEARDGRY
jgi:hypothetical protein